jgi:hypothetical protein
VLNECGKLEAAGGGLRDAFAHADAGKALSFSAAGPATADGGACRVCKRAICDCSKRARQQPVASTPLAIW